MTIALGVQIAAIGIIFGLLFGLDNSRFLPHLAVSLTLWTFLVAAVTDSTGAYIQSQQIIRQMYVPGFFPVVRVLSKNIITFGHNLSVIAIVMVIFGLAPNVSLFLFIPGIVVVSAVIYVVGLIVAIVSARYRDIPPIVSAILMVSFYVTPIIWMPDSLPEQYRGVILTWNPFYHLMELIRSPILGFSPSLLNWVASVGMLAALALFAGWMSRKYFWKIVYWL